MVFSQLASVVRLHGGTYSNVAHLVRFAICPPMVNTATSCAASLLSKDLKPFHRVLDSLAGTCQMILVAE